MQKLDESIEDTLTRLEELESGVKMVSTLCSVGMSHHI